MPKTIPAIPGIGPMTTTDNHGRPIFQPQSKCPLCPVGFFDGAVQLNVFRINIARG